MMHVLVIAQHTFPVFSRDVFSYDSHLKDCCGVYGRGQQTGRFTGGRKKKQMPLSI
jgi:hypothetical protein